MVKRAISRRRRWDDDGLLRFQGEATSTTLQCEARESSCMRFVQCGWFVPCAHLQQLLLLWRQLCAPLCTLRRRRARALALLLPAMISMSPCGQEPATRVNSQ